MLIVYMILVAVGYAARMAHEPMLRWARRPRVILPDARQVRAARVSRMIHGVDQRDYVFRDNPPRLERLGEPPDFWTGGGR